MACGRGQSKRDKEGEEGKEGDEGDEGEEGDVDERSFTDREERRRVKKRGKKEKRTMEKRCNAQLFIHPATGPSQPTSQPIQIRGNLGPVSGWVVLG